MISACMTVLGVGLRNEDKHPGEGKPESGRQSLSESYTFWQRPRFNITIPAHRPWLMAVDPVMTSKTLPRTICGRCGWPSTIRRMAFGHEGIIVLVLGSKNPRLPGDHFSTCGSLGQSGEGRIPVRSKTSCGLRWVYLRWLQSGLEPTVEPTGFKPVGGSDPPNSTERPNRTRACNQSDFRLAELLIWNRLVASSLNCMEG